MVSQAVLFAPTDRYEPGDAPASPFVCAGSRLALLPVANKPLVLHALDELLAAGVERVAVVSEPEVAEDVRCLVEQRAGADRKSTRLNSSHSQISYAVFCLKKKRS